MTMRIGTRRGTSIPSIMVAAALAGLVGGMLWQVLLLARRGEGRALAASATLRRLAGAGEILRADLAAVTLAPGESDAGGTLRVEAGGRRLVFLRTPSAAEVAGGASGRERRVVTWEAQDAGDARWLLVRRTGSGDVRSWPGAPLREVRFTRLRHEGRAFLAAELLFEASSGARVPVRIVERLRTASRIPAPLRGPLPPGLRALLPEPSDADLGLGLAD